jgi:GNAT superfamily N-acetyltransferase
MTNTASAKGIPDRAYYGEPDKIEPGTELDLVQQLHLALRAGRHFDYRFGDKKRGLYSWVTRKGVPGPGGRVAMFQQPAHSYAYKDFEGTIPSPGYGAGTVKKHDEGKILVTKTSPGFIHFTRTDKKYPERFVLFKPKTKPGRKDDWLLANVTPTKALPYSKLRYTRVAAEDVESKLKDMKEGDTVSAKVDGASALIQLLRNKAEVTSYRAASGTGFPILHTERVFHGKNQIELPPELEGTVLKGELFGTKGKKVIPPQELGGLLNATVANSLQMQRDKHIKLRSLLYDIQQYGKTPVDLQTTPRAERYALLQKVIKHLPKDKFQLSDDVPAEKALELWKQIGSGQHPLTEEGIVGWPAKGKPWKAKYTEDADVNITNVFPGEGKYEGVGAGGFEYSTDKAVTGRVGTGFSDEVRKDMLANPDKYIGRVARIRSQQQLPSGVYRAPSFIALHEDYPAAGQSAELVRSNRGEVEKEAAANYYIADSDIHGKGTFAGKDYKTGDIVGRALILKADNGLGYKTYTRTELGKFVNYQPKGNVGLSENENGDLYLEALEDIPKDAEMYTQPYDDELESWIPYEIVENEEDEEKQAEDNYHWRGVDLDGTLANYEEFEGSTVIGKPVPKMVRRIKRWLANGENVKILTARVSGPDATAARRAIEAWCEKYIGEKLPVTCKKDHAMTELWDDRAVQVVQNTGDRADKTAELSVYEPTKDDDYTLVEKAFNRHFPAGRILLVATEPKAIGGMSGFVEANKDEPDDAYSRGVYAKLDKKLDAYLTGFFVRDDQRGKGVGSSLLELLKSRYSRLGMGTDNSGIDTDPAALRIYAKAGFKPLKRETASTYWYLDQQPAATAEYTQNKMAEFTDPSYDPAHPDECCPNCGARLERGDDGDCNRCGKPWPIKEAEFDFSYEKQSFDTALHWQALKSVPFKYETGQGLLQNALGHLRRVRDAGLNRIEQQRNYNSYRDSLVGPDAKWDRLIKSVQGHPNPEGFSDVDRLIQRYTQLGM